MVLKTTMNVNKTSPSGDPPKRSFSVFADHGTKNYNDCEQNIAERRSAEKIFFSTSPTALSSSFEKNSIKNTVSNR